MRSIRILTVILALGLAALPAAGQTPDAACAADTLYLISPDLLHLDLQEAGRLGMVVSWPNLDLDQATCYSLAGEDTLDFVPTVTGGFGDRVDRVLGFASPDSGQVGANQSDPLRVTWRSIGADTYGNLAGVINLANNGGILHWSGSAGAWTQVNNGLPMSWRQVNVVALAQGTGGVLYGGFTSGQTLTTEPRGLYRYDGSTWSRVGADVFDSSRRVTAIAVDPNDNNRIAVGSAVAGLWISSDGGQTFSQWTDNLDPTNPALPAAYEVSALSWSDGRLLAAVKLLGLFRSTDGGASFAKIDFEVPKNLDTPVAQREYTVPIINAISVAPGQPNRVLAALDYHGAYESNDGGVNWHDLYGDLNVPDGDPLDTSDWLHSGRSIAVDTGNPQVMVMAVYQEGLYRTGDGGQTWTLVAQDLQPSNTALLRRLTVVAVPGAPGRFLAAEDIPRGSLSATDIAAGRGENLLESTDGGLTWAPAAVQPVIDTVLRLLPAASADGDLLLASWGGGVYIPGTELELYDTYTTATSTELRSLDLGLRIAFDDGVVDDGDAFELVCQTFQGWAVWRAPASDRNAMTLIGIYDRVNPETCIEGYCGDVNYDPVPQCFAAKRAACFDLSDPDTLRFFDAEIYNGFGYYYAISSFDYGNTAATTPESNNKAMVFSPRFAGDSLSPFQGDGNRSFVQVNLSAAPAVLGSEIYVYPNPLRLNSGIPGEDGRTVIWTNLPPNSRIRVFTVAGDDVVNLGPDNQVGGQIRWLTRNRDKEPVAAGVYLYKVDSPGRDPYWGRLVIIR